jgi:hypothetical protein
VKRINVPGIGEALYLPHELREIEQMKATMPKDELVLVLETIHALKVHADATIIPEKSGMVALGAGYDHKRNTSAVFQPAPTATDDALRALQEHRSETERDETLRVIQESLL